MTINQNAEKSSTSALSEDDTGQSLAAQADEKQGREAEAEEPASLEDVIQKAVASEDVGDSSSSAPSEDDDKAGEAEKADAAPDQEQEPDDKKDGEKSESKADDTPPPFHDHPRWKAVMSEKKELQQKVEALQDPADRYAKIDRYMQDNGISPDDMTALFEIGALVSTDPVKAVESVREFLGNLEKMTGLGGDLPADLQQKVNDGFIAGDEARELAKLRAENKLKDEQVRATQERQNRQAATQDHSRAVEAQTAALNAWEAEKTQSDPSYTMRARMVGDRFVSIRANLEAEGKIRRGAPLSEEQARQIADAADKAVVEDLRQLAPAKPAVKPSPSSSSSQSTGNGATSPDYSKANSLEQAIALAAGQPG